MKKLTIQKGELQLDLIIDKLKLVFGSNYQTQSKMLKAMDEYFLSNKSEYREENILMSKILIDDEEISKKNVNYYVVDENFSINDDFKLKTNSLTLKYIETQLNNINLFDTINTINEVFKSLENEMLINNDLLTTSFLEINSKYLSKIITASYLNNDCVCDEFDLNPDELVSLQLNMIKEIIDNNPKDLSIVIVKLRQIDGQIENELKNLNNSLAICFTENINCDFDLKDCLIIDNQTYDLADENIVFNEFNQTISTFESVEETTMRIKKNIVDIMDKKRLIISNLLNK